MISLDEEYASSVHAQIYAIAQAIASRDTSCIEGSIKLSNLRFEAEGMEQDPDMMPFVLVSSATDHLPIGRVREHWSEAALQRIDAELKRSEAWALETTRQAVESLLLRFSPKDMS